MFGFKLLRVQQLTFLFTGNKKIKHRTTIKVRCQTFALSFDVDLIEKIEQKLIG